MIKISHFRVSVTVASDCSVIINSKIPNKIKHASKIHLFLQKGGAINL